MTIPLSLWRALAEASVKLSPTPEGKLRVECTAGAISDELRQQIAAHKTELRAAVDPAMLFDQFKLPNDAVDGQLAVLLGWLAAEYDAFSPDQQDTYIDALHLLAGEKIDPWFARVLAIEEVALGLSMPDIIEKRAREQAADSPAEAVA